MKTRFLLATLIGVSLVVASAWSGAEEKKKDTGFQPKCPISGRPAKKDVTVDFHGGKVFLCCPGCISKFNKDQAKYAAKANLQLVGTGQARQKGCPMTGRKIKEGTSLEVAGVKVGFCCGGCRAKVAKAKPAEQIEKVFGDKAFSKAFELAKNKGR